MTYKAGQKLEISSDGQLTQKFDAECQNISPWPPSIKCEESMFNVDTDRRRNEKKAKKGDAHAHCPFYELIVTILEGGEFV